jgi:hypothetical protein
MCKNLKKSSGTKGLRNKTEENRWMTDKTAN